MVVLGPRTGANNARARQEQGSTTHAPPLVRPEARDADRYACPGGPGTPGRPDFARMSRRSGLGRGLRLVGHGVDTDLGALRRVIGAGPPISRS